MAQQQQSQQPRASRVVRQEAQSLYRLRTKTHKGEKRKGGWWRQLSPSNTGGSGMLRDIKLDLTPAPVRSIYEILLSPKSSPFEHGPVPRGTQRLGAGRYVLSQNSVQSKGPFPPLKETLDDAQALK